MKRKYKGKKLAVIAAIAVMANHFAGVTFPVINSYAYTEKSASVNASSLNVRSGPGTTYSIAGKLLRGTSVTVVGEKTASDGALWYEIRYLGANGITTTGYVSKSFLKFPVSYTSNSSFEAHLTAEGFPESYKVKLRLLHAEYPNWVFKAQKTNLDWDTVIQNESKVGSNLVARSSISSWKSTETGAYNWETSTWPGFDGSGWVAASEDIIRYYMDPRNFLDDTSVFQFLTHGYDSSAHSSEGLNTMVKGTFLAGQTVADTQTQPAPEETTGGTSNLQEGASNVGPGAGGGKETTSESSGASSDSSNNKGPGVINSTAPTSGGNSGVSQEAPQASISKKTANISATGNYGPGVSQTTPSEDTGSSTGSATGSSKYIDMIMNAGVQSGVNPYVLAAMIIQEQGASGTGKSISGIESGYVGYYNHFNIEAYQSGSLSAVQRGLWWASQSGSYGRPWSSPEKSVLGGALYYGTNYVKVGQDTFYLKKFNVQGSNLYKHQYMTNIQGAAGEGAVYAKAYNQEMKKTALEFKIPIYNNMPDNPCSQPTGDGSPNNKLSGLSVSGYALTPTFQKDTQTYDLIVDSSVDQVAVNASAIDKTASVTGGGTISLLHGSNTVKISVRAENGHIREYVIRIVRQGGSASGTLPESSTGNSAGPGGSASSGGSSGSSQNAGSTPGGSNVTIIPVS